MRTEVSAKRKRGRPANDKPTSRVNAGAGTQTRPVAKRKPGRPRSALKPTDGPAEKEKQIARAKRRRAREALKLALASDPAFKRRRGRPAAARAEPKPAGRPAGTTDAVTAPELKMSINAFSAVRGYLQGIDCLDLFSIYFPNEPLPSGESAALARIILLLTTLVAAATSRQADAHSAEPEATKLAAQTLKLRLAEAQARRAQLLAGAKAGRQARAESKSGSFAVAVAPPMPAYLNSVDAFMNWYIDEKLGGIDPDFGVSEWLQMFSEAVGEHRSAASNPASPANNGLADADDADGDAALGETAPTEARYGALFYGAQALQEKRGFIPSDIQASLKALDWMRAVVARPALESDLVDLYFTAATAQQLRAADIFTLYQLTHLVNRRGRMWWKDVAGLGARRAAKVNEWLSTAGMHSGLRLDADLSPAPLKTQLAQKQMREKHIPGALLKYGMGPLALLASTPELDGSCGQYRARGTNMLGAQNDIEAVIAAFAKYNDHPRTQTVYGRELCRFIRWCMLEKKKPMSSLSIPEARQYKEFLDHLPPHWMNSAFALKGADAWAPFRGQLSDASKRKALTAVNVIYAQLHSAGYLTGNPMAGVLKSARLGASAMDASRALTPEQWQHIKSELLALPRLDKLEQANRRAQALIAACTGAQSGPIHASSDWGENEDTCPGKLKAACQTVQGFNEKRNYLEIQARRLRALFFLLQSTGLRREECFLARLGHIKAEVVDGARSYLLSVVGKGDKNRVVMVPDRVMQLVMDHVADRKALGFDDDLKSKEALLNVPLISVIGKPVTTWSFDPTSGQSANAPIVPMRRRLADTSGSLSPEGMQRLAKSFLGKCSATYPHDSERDHFLKASLHWFRHTFGTTMADQGVDLRTIQRQMGHANINTTAQYSKTNDRQMIRELRKGHDAADAVQDFGSASVPDQKNLQIAGNTELKTLSF